MQDLPEFSEAAKSFKLGEYEHSKSKKHYRALGIGRHSETLEELIVYQALYGAGDIWVRPLSMFLEPVVIDGATVRRFRHVGD